MEDFEVIDLDDDFSPEQKLPNSTTVLVLGIISIVGALCYGIPGLVCGIIALVLGNKAKGLYNINPKKYAQSSHKNLTAGIACGIIGTVFSALMILGLVVYLIFMMQVVNSAAEMNDYNNDVMREFLNN